MSSRRRDPLYMENDGYTHDNGTAKSRVDVAPAIVGAGGLGDGWAGTWRRPALRLDRDLPAALSIKILGVVAHSKFDRMARGNRASSGGLQPPQARGSTPRS